MLLEISFSSLLRQRCAYTLVPGCGFSFKQHLTISARHSNNSSLSPIKSANEEVNNPSGQLS